MVARWRALKRETSRASRSTDARERALSGTRSSPGRPALERMGTWPVVGIVAIEGILLEVEKLHIVQLEELIDPGRTAMLLGREDA